MKGQIDYGFGREYLSNWSIKEALREVLQNYIDYGDYNVTTSEHGDNSKVFVTITNNYNPEKLEFLRIGNSDKGSNQDAIGHHGEGLKMAFLIFLREGLTFRMSTPLVVIKADWKQDSMVGETMVIYYDTHMNTNDFISFETWFECPKDVYDDFINNIVIEEDIIYKCHIGSIVNKPKGNIYSGNLFVCHVKNLSKSYNIKPQFLPLDRDRSVPRDWDVEYYTSQINELYNIHLDREEVKIDLVSNEELEGKDYKYANNLSNKVVDQFTYRSIGKEKVYINKHSNTPVKSRRITEILDKHPKFNKDKKVSARQQLKYKIEAADKK